jgi:hypothetical protein
MERVLTQGGNKASRPISDFLLTNDYQGPKAGTYYVDLNVAATGGGSPDHPFATLAEAITASNASIGLAANRWWARRNRTFVCGDGITESLTVLPEKCDIIGCGSDLYPFPRIIGRHTIALAKVGCRFINIGLQASSATDLMTLPAGCHGFQFLGGLCIPKTGGTAVGFGITDTACMKIANSSFQIGGGSMTHIFATAISLLGTVGHESEIVDNDIIGTVGILTAGTLAALGSKIKGNTIRSTGKPINDASGTYQVINNRLMTDINIGTTTDGYTFTLGLASGNKLTGLNGVAACVPFEVIAE